MIIMVTNNVVSHWIIIKNLHIFCNEQPIYFVDVFRIPIILINFIGYCLLHNHDMF